MNRLTTNIEAANASVTELLCTPKSLTPIIRKNNTIIPTARNFAKMFPAEYFI
jgi:hypothetical protein